MSQSDPSRYRLLGALSVHPSIDSDIADVAVKEVLLRGRGKNLIHIARELHETKKPKRKTVKKNPDE